MEYHKPNPSYITEELGLFISRIQNVQIRLRVNIKW